MNIALIAMSGIRVCDAELLRLGLTLPGFVERSKTIAALPSLGLLTLAGMTPDEHSIDYIEVEDIRKLGSLPQGYDLVGISSYSAQISEAYELARRFKAAGVPVVLGGPHVTCLPDEAAPCCDAVVAGDGEAVWLDVLRDADRGRLQPVYGRRGVPFDLQNAPLPAFQLLDIPKYNRLTVQTSRGCPHLCEFCASSILLSTPYRQKPIDRVLREIETIRSVWDDPFIEFADDNALVNKAYWKDLLTELRSMRIKWFAETDLSVSDDEALLDLMRESGCAQVLVGLESPDEPTLKGLETRSDWKRKRCKGYKQAIRRIQSHGVTVNGCFILGLDGQGPDIFARVFDFVKDAELYEVQVTIQTAFPGTPLYDRLRRERRLIRENAWETCTLFDVNFRPSGMTPEELSSGFRELVVRLYGEEFTRWRRGNLRRHFRRETIA